MVALNKSFKIPVKVDLTVTQIWVDLFCGAGGVTNGLHNKKDANGGKIKVIVCVNHDETAIKSHMANHPECAHYIEDIKTISIDKVRAVVEEAKRMYPNAKLYLWASLECTNHSNAKGGVSRNADSRTLANHLFRYLPIGFDKVYIENVREFLDWGPLEQAKDKDGNLKYDLAGEPVMMPIKAFRGDYYKGWEWNMRKRGFHVDKQILNCADYDCPTARKRLFIQFSTEKEAIRWPKPTTADKHIPIRECLDLEDYGESIFNKKKVPCDKSLERVLRGLKKFGPEQFIASHYGSGDNTRSLDQPCPSLLRVPKEHLYSQFIFKYYGNGDNTVSLELASPTLTRKDRLSLTSVFMMDYQFGNIGRSIDRPAPTLIARQDKKPLYKVSVLRGMIYMNVNDTYTMRQVKRYCWLHGIGDIRMRGLNVKEMKRITTLSEDYILLGTETEQKEFIGNAVPSNMVTNLALVA